MSKRQSAIGELNDLSSLLRLFSGKVKKYVTEVTETGNKLLLVSSFGNFGNPLLYS
jgi:hypothetical protein